MNDKMSICPGYVGVACVDGSCPIANADEYEERCYPVIKKCKDCHMYRGCEDCYFCDHELCVIDQDKSMM